MQRLGCRGLGVQTKSFVDPKFSVKAVTNTVRGVVQTDIDIHRVERHVR